jgi:hypothetical protein
MYLHYPTKWILLPRKGVHSSLDRRERRLLTNILVLAPCIHRPMIVEAVPVDGHPEAIIACTLNFFI